MKNRLKLIVLLLLLADSAFGEVTIQVFSERNIRSVVFTVNKGSFQLAGATNENKTIGISESLVLSVANKDLSVRTSGSTPFVSSVLLLNGTGSDDIFTLAVEGKPETKRIFSGKLEVRVINGYLRMLNTCQVDDYIAGVIEAEGGRGSKSEYYKTQAVLARTYMFRYLSKNLYNRSYIPDGKNYQLYRGISEDKIINKAVAETDGEVIVASDNSLIEPAFHSNCGGETSGAGAVWLTDRSYLKKVIDPYCSSTKNAKWERSFPLTRWTASLRTCGLAGTLPAPEAYNYSTGSRTAGYKIGVNSIPFTRLRSVLNLPSAFFSVAVSGDSVHINGRGFGHGVGLCQEGAMKMASKGYNYRQIINFYYTGVVITKIGNLVANLSLPDGLLTEGNDDQNYITRQIKRDSSDAKFITDNKQK